MLLGLDAGALFPIHVGIGDGSDNERVDITEHGVLFESMCCLDDRVRGGVKGEEGGVSDLRFGVVNVVSSLSIIFMSSTLVGAMSAMSMAVLSKNVTYVSLPLSSALSATAAMAKPVSSSLSTPLLVTAALSRPVSTAMPAMSKPVSTSLTGSTGTAMLESTTLTGSTNSTGVTGGLLTASFWAAALIGGSAMPMLQRTGSRRLVSWA